VKQNLKPYAYKLSEHNTVVSRQWSVVDKPGDMLPKCNSYRWQVCLS